MKRKHLITSLVIRLSSLQKNFSVLLTIYQPNTKKNSKKINKTKNKTKQRKIRIRENKNFGVLVSRFVSSDSLPCGFSPFLSLCLLALQRLVENLDFLPNT